MFEIRSFRYVDNVLNTILGKLKRWLWSGLISRMLNW